MSDSTGPGWPAQPMGHQRRAFLHSPGMDQVRLNPAADPPDEQRVRPEQRTDPQPRRGFQDMKDRPVPLELNGPFQLTAQKYHMHPERRVPLELGKQHHLPCGRMPPRRGAQRLGQVRQPLDRKVGNPSYS